MTVKSPNDPFSSKADLRHGAKCGCSACAPASGIREESTLQSSEQMMERAIESAIVRSVFGHSDISRRSFMGLVGGGTAAAALASIFPIDKAKAALLDTLAATLGARPISTSASFRSPAPHQLSWLSHWASMSGMASTPR